MKLAVRLYLLGSFRYRAAGRIFPLFAEACPGLQCPSFYSVRLWVLRIGLSRLQSASMGPRWTMICDHTATYGGMKLLVICGVDLARLEQRVADKSGDFSLDHRDVQPLAVVPMKHSSGELLLASYLECIRKHGNPERMVTDGGSDILKSARLLAEYQESREEPRTKHTYDISHRIARIVERELAPSEAWQKLEELATKARVYCKYRAGHLSPPDLRHSPDRWMNLSGIIRWFSSLKEKVASLSQEVEDQRSEDKPQCQAPRFGFTLRIWEAAKKTYNKRDGIFNALKKMCGQEYPDQQAYEKALAEKCPSLPREVKEQLDLNNDLNRTYLTDVSEGIDDCRAIHQEVADLLAFSNAIQKQVKGAGLTKKGLEICQDIHGRSQLTGVGERVGKQIMEVIEDIAKDLGETERIIVTSDVIESLNGRWKMLINGAAMPALGINTLLMPILMGDPGEIDVTEALERVRVADVEKWKRNTFDVTFFQEKRDKIRKSRPENPQEVIL